MQLNQAEFTQLQSSLLSHMARSLYIFYLQPQARQQNQITINLPYLASKLTSQSSFDPSSPSLEDVICALNELEQHNLIARNQAEQNWQNAQISFPLFEIDLKTIPQRPFAIHSNWQPGPNFRYTALHAGLLNYRYTTAELTEFINYWSERHDQRTQNGWERLFIRRLIKIHTAAVCTTRNYLRPQYDNFSSYEEKVAKTQNSLRTRHDYDWEKKFLPPHCRHTNLAQLNPRPNNTALAAPAPLPLAAPQKSSLPATSSAPMALATPSAATITNTLNKQTQSWPAACMSPSSSSSSSTTMPFYPESHKNTLIEDSAPLTIQPTTFREKRPSLTALYTGKEEYIITAPSYTNPKNYENAQNRIIGRIPTSSAQGYTPPEIIAARAQNPNYSGRPIEGSAPQPQFAAVTNGPNVPDLQLNDYGFTPLKLPSAMQEEQNKTPKPLPHTKPKV